MPSPLVSYTPDTLRENLLNTLHVRTPRRNLALQMFLTNSQAWATPVIQVPYGKNYFDIGTANAAYNNTVTTIVIAKDPKTPILPKINQEIYVPSTGEIILTSGSSADITETSTTITLVNITRGARSTTAAAIAISATLVAGPDIVKENAEFSTTDSDSFTSIRQVYFTQIFQAPLNMSGTAIAIGNNVANKDVDEAEQTQRILDHLENVKLLQACLRGVHGASSTLLNATTQAADDSRMSGIIPTITRLGSANNIIDAGGNMTMGLFDDILRQVNDLELADPTISQGQNPVGSEAQFVCLLNGFTKNKANILDASSRRRDQNETKIIRFVETYVGPLAIDFVVVPNYALFDGEMVVIKKGQYQCAPLQGLAFKKEELAKTTRGKRWGIHGQYGGVLMYPDCAFYVKNA